MLDDRLVREQPILDYKNMILHSHHGGFFKGHFWSKNCKFPLRLFRTKWALKYRSLSR